MSSTVSAQVAVSTFTDVPADYWATDYIEALAEQGAIAGFPDGSFRPDAPVTRAQFAAILRQTFTSTADATAQPFTDVSANYWAADAIAAARSARFLSGYPNNIFQPEQNIPRAQTLVSLVSGLDYGSSSPSVADDYTYFTDTYFTDGNEIPAYAQNSVAIAAQRRLVINHPRLKQLDPNRSATRAEVVATIYQALVQEAQSEPLPRSPYLVTTSPSRWLSEPVITFPIRAKDIGLSRDGRRLAALLENEDSEPRSRIEIWNTQTGEQITSMTTNEDTRFEAVAISEDGLKIAAITQSKFSYELTLLVWDLAADAPPTSESLGAVTQAPNTPVAGQEKLSFGGGVSPQITFGANDTKILTHVVVDATFSSPTTPILRVHQVTEGGTTGKVLQAQDSAYGTGLDQFDFSPDGTLLTGRDGFGPAIYTWNLDSGELVATLVPDTLIGAVSYTPTGALRTLLVRSFEETFVQTWNVLTTTSLGRTGDLLSIDRQDSIHALSPDGVHHFMRGDVAGTRILNVHTFEVTQLDIRVKQASFSETGRHLALSSFEDVRIFAQEDRPL